MYNALTCTSNIGRYTILEISCKANILEVEFSFNPFSCVVFHCKILDNNIYLMIKNVTKFCAHNLAVETSALATVFNIRCVFPTKA